MAFGNRSSWFPLKRFTRSGCHFDWMMGTTKFFGVRDFLKPNKFIPVMETVFWNRTLNANVALSTYNEIRESKDPAMIKKCEEIGLPMDIRLN